MTVYLSTTFAPTDTPITPVLERLREQGINAVELGSTHCPEPDLASKLIVLGMSYLVHNYFPPPLERFVANIASSDPDIRKRSLDHGKMSMSFCAEIGAHLYTFHPGFVTDPQGESRGGQNYDFRFTAQPMTSSTYRESFDRFLEGTGILVKHARREGVALAVESQGSIAQADHLLLQRPEEFESFTRAFSRKDIGLNVNLGHLNLAARVYAFDRLDFMRRFAENVVALEISHNDGQNDDHAALRRDAWYWPVITNELLDGAYKIFEGRDLPIDTAVEMVRWLRESTDVSRG